MVDVFALQTIILWMDIARNNALTIYKMGCVRSAWWKDVRPVIKTQTIAKNVFSQTCNLLMENVCLLTVLVGSNLMRLENVLYVTLSGVKLVKLIVIIQIDVSSV
jgi:hypothetical protein